jgi:hypothetical protein
VIESGLLGFCVAERADVPIDSERRCLSDRMPCIPPSWGRRDQRFEGGHWVPEIPKPEGYVWTPRFTDESSPPKPAPRPKPKPPKPAPAVSPALDRKLRPSTPQRGGRTSDAPLAPKGATTQTFVCRGCLTTVTMPRYGAPPRTVCNDVCRQAARRRETARLRNDAPPVPFTCAHCGTPSTRPAVEQGPVRRYCSRRCKQKVYEAGRALMRNLGMTCAGCGRDDQRHHGRGLCSQCWHREKRAAMRNEVAS